MCTFKSLFCITILSLLFSGCVSTRGDLEIEGKVTDEYTNEVIPFRNIIVQGLIKGNDKDSIIEVGQFRTDSSGRYNYILKKVKDVRYYNFVLVGDSDYAFKTRELGLYQIEDNAKFLSFSLSKLVGLSIIINRKSKASGSDILTLSWESDKIFYWSLFPYEIYNYDKTNNYTAASSGSGLRWFGGNVNSVVKTRVFSEKKTKIYWDLDRNGKRYEFSDTITCRRDIINRIYFSY